MPIAGAIFVLLLAFRERRRALLWSLTVGGVVAAIVALKLSFAGCAPPSPLASLRSPSGHTAAATMVFGGLGAVLGVGVVLAMAQSLAVAGLIGASRVLLAMHSPPEVIVGASVGLCGATALAAWCRPVEGTARRRTIAILSGVLVVALACALHGAHWSAEQLIRRTSWRYWPLQACSEQDSSPGRADARPGGLWSPGGQRIVGPVGANAAADNPAGN